MLTRRPLLMAGFVACMALAWPVPARADGGPFGLGLIVGSPTGFSAQYYLSETNSIDAVVGGAMLGTGGIQVHADYLWHPWEPVHERSFDLGIYVGVGARMINHSRKNHDNDVHLGPRAPAGLIFDFTKTDVPLDVFIEAALVLDFILEHNDDGHNGAELDVNAGLGVRYYF